VRVCLGGNRIAREFTECKKRVKRRGELVDNGRCSRQRFNGKQECAQDSRLLHAHRKKWINAGNETKEVRRVQSDAGGHASKEEEIVLGVKEGGCWVQEEKGWLPS